jgi:arylsulfatase A-like enzyme
MTRFCWILTTIVVAGPLTSIPHVAADPARPNVLLIVADDMAHGDLSIAGHPLLKTPNLDRLAQGGVRFTHAFTPNPICTPSRAAILTGQDCFTNGCYFFGMPINKDSPQFAPLFVKAGYETFYTGKWHNDGKPWTRGYTTGANYFCKAGEIPLRQTNPWICDHGGGNQRRGGKFSTTLNADAAVAFLKQRRADTRPFLMFVSYKAPHDPWTPPGEYAAMYPPEKIALPPNFLPTPTYKWFTKWHGTQLRDEALMPYPRTPAGVRDVRSRYFGMVTQLDHQTGRILDELDQQGLAEDTLVIFIADHGISLGAHGFSGKQTMYEEGIRLPMIVRYPKLKRAGETNSDLVSLTDIFPTVCDAAGIEIPKSVEGDSLLPLYRGDRSHARKEIFAAFHSPTKHRMVSRMVRTRRYKSIVNLTTNEAELYDLKEDPYEMHSLAGKAKFKELEASLAKRLLEWRREREPQWEDGDWRLGK